MTRLYHKHKVRTTFWRKLALVGLLGLTAGAAHAQRLNYTRFGATNEAGTYTDLGTVGTAISTPNTDDANSAATPIGFSFSFNGQAFTDFVLNTNGYLALGTTAPAAPYFPGGPQNASSGPLNTDAQTNLLLPFNVDLESAAATPATYSYALTGASGSQVCTIQWKNVSDKAVGTSPKQYAAFDFQVKLYEGTNRIEFVYNAPTVVAGANEFRAAVVGLKGSGAATNQIVLASKASAQAWSAASFINQNYPGNAHNYRGAVPPDAGRTYRFNSPPANDIAVEALYSRGKLPIPFGAPDTVRAYVSNVGTADQSDVRFTLTVSGANTYTTTVISSLPAGNERTIAFPPYAPTNPGTNTITVTVADDDLATNNVKTYTQLVNPTTYAYAQPGLAATTSVGFNTGSGILGTRYFSTAPRTVTGVTVRLAGTSSVGNTVYGVVLDPTGTTIIARSDDYTITAADIDKDKTFALGAVIPAGGFIAGLAQTANPATGYFPVGSQGSELPTRTGAYYTLGLAGGSPRDVGSSNLGAFMIEAITAEPATCLPPTGLTATGVTATSAIITFVGPANGTAYTVIYGPRGFDPASAGTSVAAPTSPFTLTGLMGSTDYDVYVRAACGANDQSTPAGPVRFTTACQPPIITMFPYTENFDGVTAGGELPCGITVADLNNDSKSWSVVTTNAPASGSNHMRYIYSEQNAADDWFFTPALFLRAGSTYELTFKYKAQSAGGTSEKLEVKYGSATTPADQTNLLWRNDNITNQAYVTTTSGTGANQVTAITPASSGNYYVGFHAISAANQLNLYVDDITVTTNTVTATSAALQQAISLYPNPTAGQLTLRVAGANAKNGLLVEISNMLGQRVRTTTVPDNATSQLDLADLANGLYSVKVRHGNEVMVQRIAVQK